MSVVTFSLRALGACKYEKFIEVMGKIVPVMNEYVTDSIEPVKLSEKIKDNYPATANFSYTTTVIDSTLIMSTLNNINNMFLSIGLCSVENANIELI